MKSLAKCRWIYSAPEGVIIRVRVQPQALKTEICDNGLWTAENEARIQIRVAAQPIENAANKELMRFLKTKMGIPSSKLKLIRGETSRNKDILFLSEKESTVLDRLGIKDLHDKQENS